MANNKGMTKAELDLYFGTEPDYSSDKELSNMEMLDAFSWYRNTKNNISKKKWFLEYIKDSCTKKELQEFKTIDECRFHSIGAYIRMKEHGAIFSEKIEDKFSTGISNLKNYINHDKVLKKENTKDTKVNIQDHITNSVNTHVGIVENEIDIFISNGFKSKFSMQDYLEEEKIKGLIAKKIGESFTESEKELGELHNIWDIKTDEYDDFKEAWSFFTKSQLKKYKNFVASIIIDCEIIACNKKRSNKPRKKKALDIQKMVTKVKYLKNDSKLKLESLHPIKILRADEVWVWNQKLRKIGVYYSKNISGLSIKGTTIQNFNDSSVCKTVRKPEEYFEQIIKGGKRVFKNVFKDINAKEKSLNGRINSDTLIVKVF